MASYFVDDDAICHVTSGDFSIPRASFSARSSLTRGLESPGGLMRPSEVLSLRDVGEKCLVYIIYVSRRNLCLCLTSKVSIFPYIFFTLILLCTEDLKIIIMIKDSISWVHILYIYYIHISVLKIFKLYTHYIHIFNTVLY